MMIRRFACTFAFIFLGFILTGCQSQTITIKHETAASVLNNAPKEVEKPKSIVKNSSGIIIYKDVTSTADVNVGKINFGPREVNFDLPSTVR